MKAIVMRGLASMAAGICLLAVVAFQQTANATTHPNIVQALERDGRFSTLLTALEVAGLKDTVATGGVFTVFAPTDEAFAKIPADQLQAIIADKALLADILLYHVLGGRQYSWSLLSISTPATLEGNSVIVVRDGLKVTVNGNRVLQANRFASNGLIHVVDGVLVPPTPDLPITSIIDVLKLDGRFKTLLTALDAAGLTSTVATGGTFTLLAPTDAAFDALPDDVIPALLADIPTLQKVLFYHVIGGRVSSTQLLLNKTTATLEGSQVTTTLKDFKVYINQARVVNPNVKAPNGLIHVIDSVLLPPKPQPNLVELLEADGRFKTLLTALELTGLKDTVATNGPFTVFAPTDEAFGALPAGALDQLVANPDALKKVLLYHVVAGEKKALELLSARTVPTLEGNTVRIWLGWDLKIYVNRSRVINANVDAANGIAHVINRVLLPPS